MIFLLAVRNLIKQKGRSAVCLLAILLSVGMMICVGQVIASMKQSNIKDMETVMGSNHITVRVEDGNVDNIVQLLGNDGIYGITRGTGVIDLKGGQLFCSGMDKTSNEMFNYKIMEGRYPVQNNEVCMEDHMMKQLGFRIGEEVDFPIQTDPGNKDAVPITKKLVICGTFIVNPLGYETTATQGMLLFTNGQAIELFGESASIYIKLRDTKDIRPFAEKLEQIVGSEAISLNTYLLRVVEAVEENISLIVIYAFIILISVLCLYNIFQISLLERTHQLGILRCMGMSNPELFQMLMAEGLLLGGIGIPVGVLLGLGVSNAVCSMVLSIRANFYQIFVIDTQNIILVIGLGILIIILCTLKSVFQLKKLSPIDAMRTVGNTKVIKKRRFSFICEKVLGIKGRLSYENLWIYQNRTRVTIFSISLSLAILFLISFFYKNYLEEFGNIYLDKYSYSLAVPSTSEAGIPQDISDEISSIEGVKKIYGFNTMDGVTVEVDLSNMVIDERFEDKYQQEQGKTQVPVNLFGYDEISLKETKGLLVDGTVDMTRMRQQPIVIMSRQMYLSDKEKLPYKAGDKIDLKLQMQNETRVITAIIGGIIEKTTFLNREEFAEGPEIIMSLDYMQKQFHRTGYTNLLVAVDAEKENPGIANEVNNISSRLSGINCEVSSHAEIAQKQRDTAWNLLKIVGILVGIIAFISFMNIMNTISTGILLRSREFAMMRAIGVSKLDIVQMILYEGVFYGILSAVLGCILGLIGSYVLGVKMNIAFTMQSIPWLWNIGWTLLCIIVCVLVTIPPLWRILKLNIKEGMVGE